MKKVVIIAVVVVAGFLIYRNSKSDLDQKKDGGGTSIAVAEAAAKVVDGVGTVQGSFTGGSKGPVFVFEEFHTSRVGQIETAIMLLRLREQYGVKRVGLEGAIQSQRALDAAWFHRIGGDAMKDLREDVSARLLGEGEISSAEALALVFGDEEVHGIEQADLYNKTFDTQLDAAGNYLASIAERSATEDLIQNVESLIKRGKQDEGFDLLINSDSWTRDQYKKIKAETADNGGATACESMEQQVHDIQAKAEQLSVTVDPKVRDAAAHTIGFYQTCHQRSIAMVKRTLELAAKGSNTSMAMIIGAAHTEGLTKMLRDQDTSFAVLRAVAFNPKYGSLTTEQFERKNNSKWARISAGTMGLLLNAPGVTKGAQGGRKPPPIIETTTLKSYNSAELAAMLIANAARARKRVPEDIWDQLQNLPEFRADRSSFVIEGDDVIYKTILKKTDGSDTPVWARVGTTETPEQAKTLEQKFQQARVDLGGIGKIPPTQPPSNSTAAKDEGPGDGRRGKIVISRTGPRSLAVFASTKSDVLKLGKLSG